MVFNSPALASIFESFPQLASSGLSAPELERDMPLDREEELYELLRALSAGSGLEEVVGQRIDDLEERINIIKHKLKFIEEDRKPSVLILSAVIPPIYANNSYLQYMLRSAGGKPLANYDPQGDVMPEVILLLTSEMDRMLGGLASLLTTPEWQQMPAVKKNRVFLIDAKKHLKGMDLNVADDLELLGQLLYPQYLTFTDPGESWLQFDLA